MEININLANHPFVDLRPILRTIRRGMGGLLAVIVVLGVALYFVHKWSWETRQRVNSLEVQIVRATGEQRGYEAMLQQPQNLKLSQQTDELNQLFDAKAFSWTLVMQDLETALPSGVQVTAIDPTRAKDGTVTLHVQVHGPRNKGVELVRNLEYSKYFRAPRIVGESADTLSSAGQKLDPVSLSSDTQFDLLAEYNADAPDGSELGPSQPAHEASETKSGAAKDSKLVSGKPSSKPHAATHKGGLQ